MARAKKQRRERNKTMKNTWTELRIEIDKCVKTDNLGIAPLTGC
jgi:hypothetical protein